MLETNAMNARACATGKFSTTTTWANLLGKFSKESVLATKEHDMTSSFILHWVLDRRLAPTSFRHIHNHSQNNENIWSTTAKHAGVKLRSKDNISMLIPDERKHGALKTNVNLANSLGQNLAMYSNDNIELP